MKWFWIALFTMLTGTFIVISSELKEARAGHLELISRLDECTSGVLIKLRSPWWNQFNVALTSLGSGAFIGILTAVVLILALFSRRYTVAGYILAVAAGSGVLTGVLKNYFERSRPPVALRLVEVQGFSYPSGHSLSSAALYFSFAVIFGGIFNSKRQRTIFTTILIGLILAIGVSRIYLGVHYLSDVTAGTLLGIAWASLLATVISTLYGKISWT